MKKIIPLHFELSEMIIHAVMVLTPDAPKKEFQDKFNALLLENADTWVEDIPKEAEQFRQEKLHEFRHQVHPMISELVYHSGLSIACIKYAKHLIEVIAKNEDPVLFLHEKMKTQTNPQSN